jgi:hypothetical protein
MSLLDAVGFLASGLVITAFCIRDVTVLRAVALIGNVAFLVYGIGLHLVPVFLLHAILLPVNCWRLSQEVSTRSARPAARRVRR